MISKCIRKRKQEMDGGGGGGVKGRGVNRERLGEKGREKREGGGGGRVSSATLSASYQFKGKDGNPGNQTHIDNCQTVCHLQGIKIMNRSPQSETIRITCERNCRGRNQMTQQNRRQLEL